MCVQLAEFPCTLQHTYGCISSPAYPLPVPQLTTLHWLHCLAVLPQVTRLACKGTTAVACGHSYTAAVLADGSLYTWGTGLGGQLGLGPHVTCAVWPARICAGLQGVR
jgi:hypothetical protein